ncbi:S9 family peptidase [Corynebacterium freneyi]|uniref:Dienelactone hydrolase n=1 Tax=Corynebacterium freneyi TaxID=134034 RepID=A0ABS4U5Y3_9CORY|nr:S9 family peptidase [Corynebacterium freneyi]MBP2332059.1 dienelactone hydrolase [Corynebacterium freneyi]MCG7438308.1 S9 family peptidase [Corynebacterium freneyi]WJZ05830.1 Alpha/beta hydrolase family protein [Corynebacterium freneyi]
MAVRSRRRSRDGVDPDRIVLWGTSFGAGHVIRAASRDPRVAAVIAQCPFTDGLASMFTLPPATLAPPGPTLRHVRKASKAEVRMQPGGHFDIYVGNAFERNVSEQLDFHARHVPTAVNRT